MKKHLAKTHLAALVCVAGLVLSACGNDDTSGEGTSGTGGGNDLSAEASAAFKEVTGEEPLTEAPTTDELAQRVAGYTDAPTELLIDEPLSKKPESSTTIAVVLTDVPILVEFYNAMKEAAEHFGWKLVRIDQGATPEEFAQAYDRALEIKPDLVVGSGLPRDYFDAQLTALAEADIPVIEWSSGIKPVEGEVWTMVDDPLYASAAIQLSEFLASESGMKGGVVAYNVPQFPMPSVLFDNMAAYLPTVCPDCAFEIQDAAVDDIGKLAVRATAYVQQHPDTKYVICGFGDLCTGVGQGLKAAGLDDVKVISSEAATTNLQNIANGYEYASTGLSIRQTGWQVIDLAARILNGDSTDGTRLAPQQIVTEVSDPSSTTIGAVPDYSERYLDMWQLG